MDSSEAHVPVLLKEVINYLIHNESGTYIDCTLGYSGHSLAILQRLKKDGKLIGIDLDEAALEFSKKKLKDYEKQVVLIHGNFANLKNILESERIDKVDGILVDLGISSRQLDSEHRGFSHQISGPLDMRMDQNTNLRAEEIINTYSSDKLYEIFKRYGEEKYSKNIAKTIVRERKKGAIENTSQLADIITRIVPFRQAIKSKSRIFQSLRVFINREMINLEQFLDQTIQSIKKNGRLVTIAYQSQEDKRIKVFLNKQEKPCICPQDFPMCICEKEPTIRKLTKKAIVPQHDEVMRNRRSKSAKLRAAEIIV